jgi:amidase
MAHVQTVHVSREHWSRDFDPSLPPAASAQPGDRIIVQTYCCSKGSVTRSISTSAESFYEDLDYTPGMPVTGPIAIRGAQVGDIQIADHGWTMARKGHGAIGHRIETGESRIVPIEDGEAVFLDRVRLPVRPMIGRIGTTPAKGPLRAGWPGPHGGNMDCKQLVAGTIIYLPVLIPEAHLALGDLHAVQGDGETGCAGAEIAGEVTLQVRILRGLDAPLPLLETPELIAVIYTDPDLDQAATGAVERMADFLVQQSDMSLADATMLLALAGDVAICQIVNSIMTCRMEVSKSVFSQLGIDFTALWQRCLVNN